MTKALADPGGARGPLVFQDFFGALFPRFFSFSLISSRINMSIWSIIGTFVKKSDSNPRLLRRNLMKPRESSSKAPFIIKEAWSTYFADQFKCLDPVLQNCYRNELDEILKLPKHSMVESKSIISECLKKLKKKFLQGFDGIWSPHTSLGFSNLWVVIMCCIH